MCRLALLNKEGIDYLEDKIGIVNLLNYLEKSLGGHGNGYCMLFKNNAVRIRKGLDLHNDEITDDIFKYYKNLKWFFYHTRLASFGLINSENCHPFKDSSGNVLMMNGTEPSVKPFITGNKTDTETILKMSELLHADIKKQTLNFNSVFLGISQSKVFINRNNGSLEYMQGNEKTVIFASEFLFSQYSRENIYIAKKQWQEDQPMLTKDLKKISYNNYGYKTIYKNYSSLIGDI